MDLSKFKVLASFQIFTNLFGRLFRKASMEMFGRFKNFWLVVGLIGLTMTASRLSTWIQTSVGLACVFVGGCALAWWRYKVLCRQSSPETRGNIKKLKATDLNYFTPWLFKNLIGQEKSMKSVLQVLRRNVDMLNEHRHLGSFLLVGPTGTGKTFFAQLLAEGLYGKGSLLKIPMNQGMSGEKLVEIILSSLKLNPNKVVLLDEVDKAPENVRAALYHFLDSGQLMDSLTGEWFHCPGLVIVATTNAGSEDEKLALDASNFEYGLLEHVAGHSTLEKAFLARFEAICWFGRLSAMEVAQISILHVRTYYRQNGVKVNFLCPEIIAEIVSENQRFNEFGVRQLIQVVRRKSDLLIIQAKKKGWREVEIVPDKKGDFILQVHHLKKVG